MRAFGFPIPGHAGHPENEYVNDLAVRAAKKQDASGGTVASGFREWLETQRDERERYLDYFEFVPPAERWPELERDGI